MTQFYAVYGTFKQFLDSLDDHMMQHIRRTDSRFPWHNRQLLHPILDVKHKIMDVSIIP